MHILFLTHYFPPEVNAPASRTYENTKRWVQAGHEVTIITCSPNHPQGELYPGYSNNLYQWDEKDGIRILRVKTYLSANKGVKKRTLNYISYMVSAFLQCWRTQKIDLVVSTSPQFFSGMAGYIVSQLKGIPWILEIRDLWPESIIAVGALTNRKVIGTLEGIETFLYRKADHIIPLTYAFRKHILKRGIPEQKITIVTNGADLTRFKPLERQNEFTAEMNFQDKCVLSYIGTHGMAHGLDVIFEAAARLKTRKDILFLLVGDGAERERLLQIQRDGEYSNVIMLSQQPKERMPEIIAASRACMVLLRKSDLFRTVIPSKIFESMAMARPIILGVQGESKGIIEKGECGICIEPENADELAEAAVRISEDADFATMLGNNGLRFVRTNYNRENLAADYLRVIEKVQASE